MKRGIMSGTKDSVVKLCVELLNESTACNNSPEDYLVKSFHHKNEEVVLEISNGEEDFVFKLREKANGILNNDTPGDERFYIGKENSFIEFKDIDIKGYNTLQASEVGPVELQLVLKSLAYRHALNIKKSDINNGFQQKNYFLDKASQQTLLDVLCNLPQQSQNISGGSDVFRNGIEQLLSKTEDVFNLDKEPLYTDGTIFQKKLFFKSIEKQTVKCVLIPTKKGNIVPAVYDMLLAVFYFTDQRKRQQYFHEIIDYYYETLKNYLKELNMDLSAILPLVKYEKQIKKFSPYVTLELVFRCVQKIIDEEKIDEDNVTKKVLQFLDVNKEEKRLLLTTISELHEHILYPDVSREDCYKIVRNATGTNDAEITNYELVCLENLSGIIGNYFSLTIHFKQNGEAFVLNLFVKRAPMHLERLEEFMSPVYEREQFVYNTLIPELARLGLGDITDFLPKCYFVRLGDMLIFEDMSERNYTVADPKRPFNYDELRAIVKQLAKFHACTLLYEELLSKETGKDVRLDIKFREYFKEIPYIGDEPMQVKHHKSGVTATIGYIFDCFPDVPKKMSMRDFKEKAELLFDQVLDKFNKSEKYRNVLCHGDIWTTNILLQSDENEKTINCSLVDFQLIRYCPPVQDLLILLYQSTDKTIRTRYMSDLIDEYYAELSCLFKKFNFDINEVYPYDQFIECCNYIRPQSICHASLCYQNSLRRDLVQSFLKDEQKAMQFVLGDRTEILEEMMKDDEVKVRFREIVEDLYDICESGDF